MIALQYDDKIDPTLWESIARMPIEDEAPASVD
jgi:hypothetical protein